MVIEPAEPQMTSKVSAGSGSRVEKGLLIGEFMRDLQWQRKQPHGDKRGRQTRSHEAWLILVWSAAF